MCGVNKLGLSPLQLFGRDVRGGAELGWGRREAMQVAVALLLPSFSILNGRFLVVERRFCPMVRNPQMALSRPGTRWTITSALFKGGSLRPEGGVVCQGRVRVLGLCAVCGHSASRPSCLTTPFCWDL